MATIEEIMDVLRSVYDPEIPVNIVDLGLVYDVQINGEVVNIKMTLTSPGCPLAETLEKEVKELIENLPGVKQTNVNIVWDPPWTPNRMSEEAKAMLGV